MLILKCYRYRLVQNLGQTQRYINVGIGMPKEYVVDPAQSIFTREHLDQCIILKQMKPLINSDTDVKAI